MTAALVPPAGRQGPGAVPGALVKALDLAFVRRAGGVSAGEHRGTGVGAGTELAQLRPYQPGDDVRQLDPAATARTGIPHVRQQVPERLLTTWLALDISRLDGVRHRRPAQDRRGRGRGRRAGHARRAPRRARGAAVLRRAADPARAAARRARRTRGAAPHAGRRRGARRRRGRGPHRGAGPARPGGAAAQPGGADLRLRRPARLGPPGRGAGRPPHGDGGRDPRPARAGAARGGPAGARGPRVRASA